MDDSGHLFPLVKFSTILPWIFSQNVFWMFWLSLDFNTEFKNLVSSVNFFLWDFCICKFRRVVLYQWVELAAILNIYFDYSHVTIDEITNFFSSFSFFSWKEYRAFSVQPAVAQFGVIILSRVKIYLWQLLTLLFWLHLCNLHVLIVDEVSGQTLSRQL